MGLAREPRAVSPWDRNNPEYGRPGYVRVYHGQLRELLTQYGKLHELWFDGGNGGDGYYGGAREMRKIDAATYYEWDVIRAMVRELQPDAVMFADEVSKDGQTWGKPAGEGEFANIAANRSIQAVRFDAPVTGRYLHLVLPRAIQDKPIIGLAGIGILTR